MTRETFMARGSTRLGRARAPAPSQSPAANVAARRAPLSTRAELLAQFSLELAKVGGAVHAVRSNSALELGLMEFVHSTGGRKLVGFGKSNFERFGFDRLWRELDVSCWERGDEGCAAKFRARAAAADIGLSIADLGVASSGSMLFLVGAQRPRSVTLLPRSHVAILTADSIVADLAAALDVLGARGTPPSSALFITGPSRTSDIENDLTLGVHGPAAVTVFLLDN